MCEAELEGKYKALVQGRTLLESCLHLNLSEHINSEVGLGTITNIEGAKEWLRNSFLFQRIQKNPRHYAINKESNQSWQERVDELVLRSVTTLKDSQLLECDEKSGTLCSTEYGDIMSKVYFLRDKRIGWSNWYLVLHQAVNCTFSSKMDHPQFTNTWIDGSHYDIAARCEFAKHCE